ncbi:MAG: MarC family protein, partial [Paracoccaceae bacterium]
MFDFSVTLFITSFVTLFVIIDPIGLTPVFVSLTNGETASAR